MKSSVKLAFDPIKTRCLRCLGCLGEVWNGGQGGQCPMMPSTSGFGLCKTHAERHAAEGLAHGRVDGTIPLDAWTSPSRGPSNGRMRPALKFCPNFGILQM